MTRLRKMMLEELERRNYSEATTRCYIRTVEDFTRRFKCSPDGLGPEHIREYQAELFKKHKLSPGTVTQRLAALRFFYIKTLKKTWSIAETPYPKKGFHLPSILSREEVARLINAAPTPFHRTLLMTLYATGVRRAELTHLKVSDIDSKRMVIHVQGGKGRKDRDVMLSPKLLEVLREHWRGLRHKPSTWLFPGNRWHTGDTPITTKVVWDACKKAAQQAGLQKDVHPPAVPAGSLIGSPLAGWLLGVHWRSLAGWRWLFILEGFPAIILGIVTIFYLTDWPAQARWLPESERNWLVSELQAELEAKKKKRNYTMMEVFGERRILILVLAYLLAMTGYLGNVYWIPTFVKRISGFSNQTVTSLLMIPAMMGILGMLINGWHSDKTNERHWHTGIPVLAAGLMFFLSSFVRHDMTLTIVSLLLGTGFLFAYFPTFWAIPTAMLSEAAAAASFGLINSIGQLGGFTGNYAIGFLNDRTHSLTASFAFIALVYFAAGGLILSLRVRDPAGMLQGSNSS